MDPDATAARDNPGDGHTSSAAFTDLVSVVLLLAPLWLTTLHTARSVRPAQHMTGVERGLVNPYTVAVASCVLPPLGTALMVHALNRAWREWRDTPGAHT